MALIERRSVAGLRISRHSQSGALLLRLGLGFCCAFRIRTYFVEGPAAGLRWRAAAWRRHLEIRARLGSGVPDGRIFRGINLARLSAIYADPRHRFLVGSAAAFTAVWVFPRHKSRRDTCRVICGGRRRTGLLPQPLVHRIAVVGGWLPRQLGLGGIVFLRHVGQRAGSAGTPAGRAPHRPTAVERRHDRPRRQPAGFVPAGHRGHADVAVVGTQSPVPFPQQRLETCLAQEAGRNRSDYR